MDAIKALIDKFQSTAMTIANDYLLPIGGGIVVLALIWGGVQYTQGNAEAGKKTILAAIVGLVIIAVASWLIALFSGDILNAT